MRNRDKITGYLISGDQERKLQRKKNRAREEEEKKQLLDLEEEKLAAERRREYLDKAKQTRYYDTDRVRTFHVRLYSCDTLLDDYYSIEFSAADGSFKRT